MADIHVLAMQAMKAKGAADAAALAARAVSGEAKDWELLEKKSMVPTWRPRDFSQVPVGTPYKWEDMVYNGSDTCPLGFSLQGGRNRYVGSPHHRRQGYGIHLWPALPGYRGRQGLPVSAHG